MRSTSAAACPSVAITAGPRASSRRVRAGRVRGLEKTPQKRQRSFKCCAGLTMGIARRGSFRSLLPIPHGLVPVLTALEVHGQFRSNFPRLRRIGSSQPCAQPLMQAQTLSFAQPLIGGPLMQGMSKGIAGCDRCRPPGHRPAGRNHCCRTNCSQRASTVSRGRAVPVATRAAENSTPTTPATSRMRCASGAGVTAAVPAPDANSSALYVPAHAAR